MSKFLSFYIFHFKCNSRHILKLLQNDSFDAYKNIFDFQVEALLTVLALYYVV